MGPFDILAVQSGKKNAPDPDPVRFVVNCVVSGTRGNAFWRFTALSREIFWTHIPPPKITYGVCAVPGKILIRD